MTIALVDFDAYWKFNDDWSDATENGHAITPSGAVIDNDIYKIGGGSGDFDQIDDYGTLSDAAIWNLGANDFSIILGIRFHTSLSGYNTIFSKWNGGAVNDKGWAITYSTVDAGIIFEYTTNGATYKVVSRSWTPSLNIWYLMYIIREENVMRMYIDNSQLGTDIAFVDTIYNATITPAFNTFFADGNPSIRAGIHLDACGKMPTALTSTQRNELWNSGNWLEPDGVIAVLEKGLGLGLNRGIGRGF